MMRTYQVRLANVEELDVQLSSYAALYGKVERTLFCRLASGDDINSLKKDFIPRFAITARQFNAVRIGVGGKISSIKERRPVLIDELKKKIEKAKRIIKSLAIKAPGSDKLHQKKRRLAILEQRMPVLKEDHKNATVRICFGSKKLFRAQFALEDNGYNSHGEWLKDWQAARNNQFFVIGSKDETAGCQGCVATVAEDGSISLRLRLPNGAGQKHTVITGLRFAHGHDAIVAAIGRNLSKDKQDWQAISYRFLKDAKSWRVFVSVTLPEVKRHSDKRLGVIGVDINEDFLAVIETDRYGNPIATWTIPCCTYGKSREQSRAIIGNAMKKLMAIATPRHKPLVLEELDFRKKKTLLENSSPKYARMLSSFAYTQIQTVIRSRAFDMGIEVFEVNPAYTSVIGEYKFAKKYGLSVHHAAALVIGRRTLGLSETLPSQLHVTLPLPARNRSRHVWSKWAAVSRANAKAKAPRKAPAALAAHSRPGKHPRSTAAPVFDKARGVTIPSVAGAIPACESSLELFG